MLREAVERLWPELEWIEEPGLREQVTMTWIRAFEESPLDPEDLNEIPFTLLVPDCPTTFMEHKRCVVHIARPSAIAMKEFMGNALAIRSARDSLFQIGLLTNPLLLGSVGLTFALQLGLIYWEPLRSLFHLAPLSVAELAGAIAASSVVFLSVELVKWVGRRRRGA